MKLLGDVRMTGARSWNWFLMLAFLAACTLGACGMATAQTDAAKATPAKPEAERNKVIYLTNLTQQNDLTEVQTDLRNMLTKVRIYGLPSLHAISVHGTPEDIADAEQIVAVLDKPRPTYRLTFTMTGKEDAEKRSVEMMAVAGEKAYFKMGTKVPIVTGSFNSDTGKANTQVQYQDVGLNIDVTVEKQGDGVRLHAKVEQSAIAEEKAAVGAQDPILQQSVLDNTSTMALGKPQVIGCVELPGSGHRQEISVVAEQVK